MKTLINIIVVRIGRVKKNHQNTAN